MKTVAGWLGSQRWKPSLFPRPLYLAEFSVLPWGRSAPMRPRPPAIQALVQLSGYSGS